MRLPRGIAPRLGAATLVLPARVSSRQLVPGASLRLRVSRDLTTLCLPPSDIHHPLAALRVGNSSIKANEIECFARKGWGSLFVKPTCGDTESVGNFFETSARLGRRTEWFGHGDQTHSTATRGIP